ncbi:MAG: glycerol-3-phosphate 1-O-acyltransferase PlsY [Gammaproteobacteria bacterium]
MLDLAIKIVLAYLTGSLVGSLLVGRLIGGIDIRKEGSGTAGGTNALRTHGKLFAFWVVLIDVGKGVLAVLLIPKLAIFGLETLPATWQAVSCGMAAMVGHVWPVFFGFRGGKGMATFLGVLGVVSLPALGVSLATWLVVLVLSGFVGLSTIIAAIAVPAFAFTVTGIQGPLFAFGIAMALFIGYTHRSNISRMLDGSEHRFEKVMLFRRLKS